MKIPWLKLGPTGKFPRGRLNSSDEGEIQIALAADYRGGVVRLEFGGPVTWIGLPPEHARALAQMLVELAESVERGQGRRREDSGN